jgi:NAD(P)-dependent dehydrogenase (short-subunit alcohol dehydrogenase family)
VPGVTRSDGPLIQTEATGGSRGYGAGIAEAFVQAGARVWITGRNEAKLNETAQRIGATPFVQDVAEGVAWDRLIPPRDPAVLAKCISPADLGQLLVQTARLPAHLVAEEIKLWPMVQPLAQL